MVGWLRKYGITDSEQEVHGIVLGPDCIRFPLSSTFTNIRWFKEGYPKYTNEGKRNQVWKTFTKTDDRILVLVEDVVSAIKVGRVYAAYPICGSSVPIQTLHELTRRCEKLVIWLDSNMRERSIKTAQRAGQWTTGVQVVFSDLDPKSYSESEIEKYVSIHTQNKE